MMALTRRIVETVKERAARDPKVRIGLLTEAAECFLNGDVATGETLLRDYVNATIGFQELGQRIDKKPASLMRMLSEKGNPHAGNLSELIASLRHYEGVRLHVGACR